MPRPLLVPPKSDRVVDRIRYWARARGMTLTQLGQSALGISSPSNARRPFDSRRRSTSPHRYWRPADIDAICAALDLSEDETGTMHRLAARELGWRI
jgi:hypothetical protein